MRSEILRAPRSGCAALRARPKVTVFQTLSSLEMAHKRSFATGSGGGDEEGGAARDEIAPAVIEVPSGGSVGAGVLGRAGIPVAHRLGRDGAELHERGVEAEADRDAV